MTNPFQAFAVYDEDDGAQVVKEQKVKRSQQEKKAYKQQQDEAARNAARTNAPIYTELYPEHVRGDAKQIRNPRHPPTPLTKQLGDGHFHDRRSGTGRVYQLCYLVIK
jgi:hypothetical protein